MKKRFRVVIGLILWLNINFAYSQSAQTVLLNANIYGHPNAEAIAITNGKISDIGSNVDVQVYTDAHTLVIDLAQAFVMPGFIDNHNHVFEAASSIGGSCELALEAGLTEQIPYLKQCRLQDKTNGWIIGYGFSIDAILQDADSFTPLEVIDSVFPNQPVIIMEQTSHAMWVNSVALDKAGISVLTPDPQGGKILKDEETGKLLGILLDNAGDRVMEQAWNSIENNFEASYEGLLTGLAEAAKHGITTIGDGRLYWKRGWYEVWLEAEQEGDLSARVSLRPWIYPEDPMSAQLTYLNSIYSNNKERLILVNQVKMYSDGIFINGTAKMLAPYLDSYIPEHPFGINYIPPKQLSGWLESLNQIGYGAHIHAIGDGAVRESLNAIENMRTQGITTAYTLTHVELIDQEDRIRFPKLDVTADFQVGSDYVVYHDHQWAEAILGAKRARALLNLRAIYNTGANVTLSSDWNVHDINPLVGLANSLMMADTGLPSLESAIDAYTINAADSLGLADITGSIEIGKSADFAVLDTDITRLSNPEDIKKTKVIMTLLMGDIVYQKRK